MITILSRLLKSSFTSALIILLMTLQMSACNTQGSAETIGAGDNDISLSWIAPAEREDNTTMLLSDIAGYKIYYGTTQGDYNNSVDIHDGSAEGYTFKDFSAGTYYFVVTTYDTEGRESQYSSEIKIVI